MKYWDEQNKENFVRAVAENKTIAGVIRALGLSAGNGSHYRMIKMKVKKLGLDTIHWTGQATTFKPSGKKLKLEQILTEHSTYISTYKLKNRLFKEGLLENQCSICGLTSWNNQEISCQLDHINGIFNDNRIENLRILCPNCHSQTETYGGKSLKLPDKLCPTCNNKIQRRSKSCGRCRIKF